MSVFDRFRRVNEYQPYRWEALSRYNGECGRGIVHTIEYDVRMAAEQRAFNDEMYGPGEPEVHRHTMIDPRGSDGIPIFNDPVCSVCGCHDYGDES